MHMEIIGEKLSAFFVRFFPRPVTDLLAAALCLQLDLRFFNAPPQAIT